MSRRITAAIAAAVTVVLATAVASGGSRAPGQQPPKNQTPPSIKGDAQVPNIVSASTGTWQGKTLKYAYQWLRCDLSGAACAAVGGATTSTKTLSSADVGQTLRVIVTASNRNGSAAATSTQTAVVAPATSPAPPAGPTLPSTTSPPTISGTNQQGQTLSASPGSWSGTTPVSYAYQWKRCDSGGGSCAAIAGASSTTYLLASLDVGSTMRVSVTASNSAGSTTASSAATAVVTAAPSLSASLTVDGPWYSGTSAWNTPIPANAPIHPNSASMVNALNTTWCPNQGCLGPADYYGTPSAWIAGSSTPLTTVWVNWPTSCHQSEIQVPIPAGAVPSSSGDPEPVMTILNKDNGDEWDFYKIVPPGATPVSSTGPQNCPASDHWQTTGWYKYTPGWTGSGSVSGSTRASGTPLGSGLIRPRDAQQPPGATWDHAIAFAYNGNLAGARVYPATGADGQCHDATTCPPMGARFQLDPSINCATWPSISYEWMRQECRTLQKYGAIIIDSGNGFVTENIVSGQSSNPNADAPHNGLRYPWNAGGGTHLPPDLVSRLRVIDWTRWTG